MTFTISDADTSNVVILDPVVNGNYIGYDDVRHGNGDTGMAAQDEWHQKVKGILKGELKRRDMSYRQLAKRLQEMGVAETERNIANKISRGGFSAVFFIQCLEAMGSKEIRL